MLISKPLYKVAPWLLLFFAFYAFGTLKVANKHKNKYIWSDAEGYYMYLPALFIYGGFEDYPVRTTGQFKFYPGSNKLFTKYTCGVAILQAPFFGLAYISRLFQGKDPKVMESNDYGVTQLIGACFYGTLGLYFLFLSLTKGLVPKFTDPTTIKLTLGILVLGTNLLFYITRAPIMSHVYSFFLFSLVIYLTPELYRHLSWKYFGWLGTLIGLIVLIRPTSLVLLLYPIFYGVYAKKDILPRLQLLWHQLPKLIFALFLALLVWLPQFIYWKYISGDWLLYSYQNEGFTNWASPKVFSLFFAPLNGWLIYNPVLAFALVGFFWVVKRQGIQGLATLAIFLLTTYLFASWWCWHFGGGFSIRSYVDFLPLLAIPLAFSVDQLKRKTPKLQYCGFALIDICCVYNLALTWSYKAHWSERDVDWTDYWKFLDSAF